MEYYYTFFPEEQSKQDMDWTANPLFTMLTFIMLALELMKI